MDNFFKCQSTTGLLILYFLAINAGNLSAFAENTIAEDCKCKTGVEILELDKVNLPDNVKEMMTDMGKNYKTIAEKGFITKEDVIKLRDNNKLDDFSFRLINLYSRVTDEAIAEEMEKIGKLIDDNQDPAAKYDVLFSMKMKSSTPYTKGTRYSVFNFEDAEQTY